MSTESNHNIKYESLTKEINSLDDWQKLKIYMHYYCSMLSIKHRFEVLDEQKVGYGIADKTIGKLMFYYYGKNIPIMSYEDFVSEKNISVVDMGEDWHKFKYAQRYMLFMCGIYYWYERKKEYFKF